VVQLQSGLRMGGLPCISAEYCEIESLVCHSSERHRHVRIGARYKTKMKKTGHRRINVTRKTLIVAATLFGLSVSPATSQVRLDMSLITCDQWLNAAWDQQNFMRAWMSGYFNASRNNNILDFRYLKRNEKKVTAYCKRHKSETLMSAIQKNAI
jgi:hypothetical protein